jgi:STE24 endopeptidase
LGISLWRAAFAYKIALSHNVAAGIPSGSAPRIVHWFTALFLAALGLATAAHLWLAFRQMRHVAANRASVPAGFEDRIPLSAHQKAADYTIAKTRIGMLETITAAALVLAFTVGGGLQLLSDAWSAVVAPGGYAHGVALVVSVVLVSSAVDLPFSLWRAFVIEQRFGFNRMTLGLFVADLLKQAVLSAILGIPLLACVLWLMARAGSAWWLYAWLIWIAFSLVVHFLYPTVFARWFNKFSPLTDAALKQRIEALLAKCGFRAKGLFVMDGSKRSSHGNAYFTGFGAAKRIVLFDTLLSRLRPPEIEAVLAHELGHFSLRHVWKRMLLVFVVSLAMLWLLGWLANQPWFYAALGVRTPGTAAALVLFFMVVPVFTFLLHPLASLYSRKHEYEADAYAARHADAAELARALVKLYEDNAATLTPDPLHSVFYDSHPPAAYRIARLRSQGA